MGRKVTGLVMMAAVASIMFAGGIASAGENEALVVALETNRVLEAHPAFIAARADFQSLIASRQAEIAALEDEGEAQARQQLFQQEMQQEGMRLQEEAVAAMRADIGALAEENGYAYVVDANMILYGEPVRDITEEVIASFPEPETAEIISLPEEN